MSEVVGASADRYLPVTQRTIHLYPCHLGTITKKLPPKWLVLVRPTMNFSYKSLVDQALQWQDEATVIYQHTYIY